MPVTSVVGQTGAITATQVRDALLTVDGSGSGLDADTLDGSHASAFAAAGAINSFTYVGSATVTAAMEEYNYVSVNLYASYGAGIYASYTVITGAGAQSIHGEILSAVTSGTFSLLAQGDPFFSQTKTVYFYRVNK